MKGSQKFLNLVSSPIDMSPQNRPKGVENGRPWDPGVPEGSRGGAQRVGGSAAHINIRANKWKYKTQSVARLICFQLNWNSQFGFTMEVANRPTIVFLYQLLKTSITPQSF